MREFNCHRQQPETPSEWASYYVELLGWYVFPLVQGTKRPLSDFALDLRHGFKDATNDLGRVEKIWRHHPDAGVAVATGAPSGLVVVDIDPRSGGDAGLVDLKCDHGPLPVTPVSLTGGGGQHLLFQHPGFDLRCRTHLGGYRGVDLKADGGYIVAPPSIHPDGPAYAWEDGRSPTAAMIPELPSFLSQLAAERSDAEALSYEQETWDGVLPAEAARLIACSRKVFGRYHRDPTGLNDPSPSGVDYSLACQLALGGVEPTEIEAAIKASRSRVGLPAKRGSYFRSTVGKAIALADRSGEEVV